MNKKQRKNLIRIIISGALMVIFAITPLEGLLRFLVFMVPYILIGYDILRKAFKGIFKGQVFDENFLMAVATIGAILLGEYTEGVAVMLFYQIGEFFQSYAVGKSRRNISELMDIRPDYANVERDGRIVQVDPDEVEVGSEIVVQPGEKIPIDGVVVGGSSSLNTSALTGESFPRDVASGDEVLSGCVNMTGVLRIVTTKEFGESTVSKILELVENSSSRKSRQENFISRFAHYYTPAVCALALILAVLPPLIRLGIGVEPEWQTWIYRALTSLVISCPCALVISIPLSFFAGIGGASREGILIKGSSYMETLSQTKCVAFDKTGTLTQGVFEVTGIRRSGEPQAGGADGGEAGRDIKCMAQALSAKQERPQADGEAGSDIKDRISDDPMLFYAAYAECASSHPISRSLKEAYGKPIDRGRVKDIEEIGGNGVTALVDGVRVAAGNRKLMERLGIAYEECKEAGTVVHVAVDGTYEGYILISDVVKPASKEAISELKKSGVARTVMLTGDGRRVAEATAKELGIDEAYAELLPADKVSKVEELLERESGKDRLVFVGDGINDAPVLSRADIGIAMGGLGSDAAIEAADVVLMDDDPMKIATAIKISRKCIRIVYQNTYFAIIVKAVCLILAAVGIANMWMAIFADVGVMVIAVLNAIRALYNR